MYLNDVWKEINTTKKYHDKTQAFIIGLEIKAYESQGVDHSNVVSNQRERDRVKARNGDV